MRCNVAACPLKSFIRTNGFYCYAVLRLVSWHKEKETQARPAGTKEHLFTAKDEENVKTKLTNPNSFSPVIIIAKP